MKLKKLLIIVSIIAANSLFAETTIDLNKAVLDRAKSLKKVEKTQLMMKEQYLINNLKKSTPETAKAASLSRKKQAENVSYNAKRYLANYYFKNTNRNSKIVSNEERFCVQNMIALTNAKEDNNVISNVTRNVVLFYKKTKSVICRDVFLIATQK